MSSYRLVAQIRYERKTGSTAKRIHSCITIPIEVLEDMGLSGDRYDRTADVVYDKDTKTITITKARY